jgi:apolipoprotein D and lipocalin family protein
MKPILHHLLPSTLLARLLAATLLAATLLSGPSLAHSQTVAAVPHLDDMAFRGAYYQIARIPEKRDKRCLSNSAELVARGDKTGQLLFVDSCKDKGSYAEVHNLTAKRQAKNSDDGRLKIATIFPFTRKYWILAAAPDFTWYLAGSPDHKTLFVYAKTSTLQPELLAQAKGIASTDGFDVSRLVMTVQDTGAAQGTAVIAQ